MNAAFKRIYFDLETDIALRLTEKVKESGKTQRAFIRDAIVAAITSGETSGKGKAVKK